MVGDTVTPGDRRNLGRVSLYPYTSKSLGLQDGDVRGNLGLCGPQSPTDWPCDPVSYRMARNGGGRGSPCVFCADILTIKDIYGLIPGIGVTLAYIQGDIAGGIQLLISLDTGR